MVQLVSFARSGQELLRSSIPRAVLCLMSLLTLEEEPRDLLGLRRFVGPFLQLHTFACCGERVRVLRSLDNLIETCDTPCSDDNRGAMPTIEAGVRSRLSINRNG